ncbi:hypothetical protein BgiMline_026620 [Biomphalaria glabrata]|nr:hypothetical protein BgiMline_021084 [Biomphalaria glabrata]
MLPPSPFVVQPLPTYRSDCRHYIDAVKHDRRYRELNFILGFKYSLHFTAAEWKCSAFEIYNVGFVDVSFSFNSQYCDQTHPRWQQCCSSVCLHYSA